MKATIAVLVALAFIGSARCWTSESAGSVGTVYKLTVDHDVFIDGTGTNKNSVQRLAIGKNGSKRRTLIQMEDLPTGTNECDGTIQWAMLYMPYHESVGTGDFISRPVTIYQVKKEWDEAEATKTERLDGVNWDADFLSLSGSEPDAGPQIIDSSQTVRTFRPTGFMEFDVTDAVKNWNGANPDPNYGLLIIADNDGVNGKDARFLSHEFADEDKRPFIKVLCTDT